MEEWESLMDSRAEWKIEHIQRSWSHCGMKNQMKILLEGTTVKFEQCELQEDAGMGWDWEESQKLVAKKNKIKKNKNKNK